MDKIGKFFAFCRKWDVFFFITQMVLIGLKVFDKIDWSWWIVLSPTLLIPAIVLAGLLLVLMVGFCVLSFWPLAIFFAVLGDTWRK